MKKFITGIFLFILFSCGGSSADIPAADTTAVQIVDTLVIANTESSPTFDLRHKYSYVKSNADGSMVAGLLELYGTNDYTQAVTINGFTQSGRGTFYINGDNVTLSRKSGIAIDGVLTISKGNENRIWLTMSNGVTYVEDDNSYFIKNMIVTPNNQNDETKEDYSHGNGESKDDVLDYISYEGTMRDDQSGISQDYLLKLKKDFSSASIGDGPYTRIEDQGDGSYLWIDGTIIGMSFKPMQQSCTVYGSDGSYFCTLYRK